MDTDRLLLAARVRGFLVTEVPPSGSRPSTTERDLYAEWDEHCEELRRYRVFVFPDARSGWRVLLGFPRGADGEMRYVLDALTGAFVRHLGRAPDLEDPDLWMGTADDRATAEALACELVALDSQPRDVDVEHGLSVVRADSTVP